jgi:glycosyltransferase involved in cell wall biosynthesis
MKVLIVCGRFPEPDMKGDQLRVLQQVEMLAATHVVTVLTGGTASSSTARERLEALAAVETIAVGRFERLLGALAGGIRGLPLQVGWMTPGRVKRAAARAAGHADVVIVSTIRALPGPLPGPVVLDHVDALSENMRQRSQLEARLPRRLGATLEARLLRAHEQHVASWVAAQTVVSPIDAELLPQHPRPVVIPMILMDDGSTLEDGPRDIDVIVTGNMRYPPNRDAAQWLAGEIVPRLRRRRPDVRVLVAGRSAGELAIRNVDVASDVPDLSDLLRRTRVAAVPLRVGTGAPIKLLEAAACGAAVVCTPWVARAVGIDADTATDADSFADAIERLLADETRRRARAVAGRAALDAHKPEAVRRAWERLLAEVVAPA